MFLLGDNNQVASLDMSQLNQLFARHPDLRSIVLARELGHGSTSTVYAGSVADAAGVKHYAAIKVIYLDHDDQAGYEQRVKEIEMMKEASQNSQNLVKYYSDFTVNVRMRAGQPMMRLIILATEYMRHSDLGELIQVRRREDRKFPEIGIWIFAFHLLRGLASLHQLSIIHRDIKPANLVLDQHNNLFITDLGISVRKQDGPGEPGDRHLAGTPLYMAPELDDDPVQTEASDIWAAGCSIMEVMILEPAFKASNEAVLIQKTSQCQTVVQLDQLEQKTGYSPLLCDLVRRMIQVDPSRRPMASSLLQEPVFKLLSGACDIIGSMCVSTETASKAIKTTTKAADVWVMSDLVARALAYSKSTGDAVWDMTATDANKAAIEEVMRLSQMPEDRCSALLAMKCRVAFLEFYKVRRGEYLQSELDQLVSQANTTENRVNQKRQQLAVLRSEYEELRRAIKQSRALRAAYVKQATPRAGESAISGSQAERIDELDRAMMDAQQLAHLVEEHNREFGDSESEALTGSMLERRARLKRILEALCQEYSGSELQSELSSLSSMDCAAECCPIFVGGPFVTAPRKSGWMARQSEDGHSRPAPRC